MIHLVTALPCEAKPLIDHFRLKRVENAADFPLYHHDSVRLIISGIGEIASAAAAAYLQALSGSRKNHIWINIGCAGHKTHPVGTLFIANKVTGQKFFYPCFAAKPPCPTLPLITVDKPELSYKEDALYDMEGAGFFYAASIFSTVELIHCLKVVSDNAENPPHHVNKHQVEKLIRDQLPSIETWIQRLQALRDAHFETHEPDLQPFLEKWHFSKSRQHRLTELLRKFEACGNSQEVIEKLEHDLHRARD